jgi:hypothetical protein
MNSTASTSIAIRPARHDDLVELWRVAALDSSIVPDGPLLVAESDGELVAALSLASGAAIADPFVPTAPAVDVLRLRASQLPQREGTPRRGVLRRRRGPVIAAPAAQ